MVMHDDKSQLRDCSHYLPRGRRPRPAFASEDGGRGVVEPTLSILLPVRNDGPTLARQLDAIVPQLRDVDQLVFLDDGSTDDSLEILKAKRHSNTTIIRRYAPSGVCEAYNQCAAHARGTWVLGCSGNDEVQPGTIAEWHAAAIRWPHARVMFGHICDWPKLPFRTSTDFVAPDELPELFRVHRGLNTHGAAAFLRRDSWGRGYIHELAWMADWYQTMMLAFQYGFVQLDHICSRVTFGGDSFSAGHADDAKFNRVIDAMRKEWERPDNDHIRELGTLFDRYTGWLANRHSRPAPMPAPRPTGRLPCNRFEKLSR